MKIKKPHAHLLALDGMRGIAAICVLLGHFRIGERYNAFSHSGLAVDFFLILSGFIISLAYFSEPSRRLTQRQFVVRRITRLWPMVLAGTLIGLAFYPTDAWLRGELNNSSFNLLRAALCQILLIPLSSEHHPYILNFVFWSLFWEFVFNILHSIAQSHITKKRIVIIAIFFAIALLIMSIEHGTVFVGFNNYQDFIFGGIRLGFCYIMGMVIFHFRDTIVILVPPLPFYLVGGALFCLLASPFDVSGPLAGFMLLALILPVLFAFGLSCRASRWPSVALGILSYPLYAIHAPVVSYVQRVGLDYQAVAFPILRVLTIAALLLFSYALGRWVDLPISRRWKQRVQSL